MGNGPSDGCSIRDDGCLDQGDLFLRGQNVWLALQPVARTNFNNFNAIHSPYPVVRLILRTPKLSLSVAKVYA